MQKNQVTASDVSFAETIGVNRSLGVKIFHKREQAMQWLADD